VQEQRTVMGQNVEGILTQQMMGVQQILVEQGDRSGSRPASEMLEDQRMMLLGLLLEVLTSLEVLC